MSTGQRSRQRSICVESADFRLSIFRNRAEEEMQAIVVNSGREVTMRRVAGRIQVRHHY
jgi:hypothetical protein